MSSESAFLGMVGLFRTRIGVRVALLVTLVVTVVFGFFGVLTIHSQYRFSIDQIERNAYQVSETIKSSTRDAMMANRPEYVRQIIATIGRQEGIEKVRIFNKEGRVIYSPDESEVNSMVDQQAEACFACHAADSPLQRLPSEDRSRIFEDPAKGFSLGLINPIYNEPGCGVSGCHPSPELQSVLGVLDVTMSLSEAKAHLQDNLYFALVLLIGCIAAIAGVIWFSFRFVNKLLLATEAVARGDLSQRLDVRGQDDIGRLAKSLNVMIEKMQEGQAQVYRSDKLASLGRLAAGVAHEINNPLTGVLSFSSFLLKRMPKGSEDREDLETIVRETKRCREIVKGLLDFARQVPPRKSFASVNTAIENALEIVRNQLIVKGVSVKCELGSDLPRVYADSGQLVQVILNLVVNASDATADSEDGRIVIVTRSKPLGKSEGVELRISDNGRGIPADLVESIFDPFFTTKGNAGTGLGLSVVWGIVNEHGGTVKVESEEGEGTTFLVHLPTGDKTPPVGS